MKVEFKVHGVAPGQGNVKVIADGEEMTATVPCLEVELVTTQERNGSLTLRIVGQSIEDAKALFKKDALITADFSAKE